MTTGIMEVTVVSAKGLKNTELFGQGGSPVWNEKYKFSVEYKAGDEEQHKLLLKLMDRDRFTDDDFLGHATIYLKGLFEQGVENGKAELHTQKYRVSPPTKLTVEKSKLVLLLPQMGKLISNNVLDGNKANARSFSGSQLQYVLCVL
ncbi:phloem protein 1 [Sesamum angolense]|uniref:Phloem protein 1 n=1 Tax=Sesamum angolense TaxID=2727404 RepID=A0AAE2BHD8_9LAMI|nr:phloem protein 1 [Sesamum angolense]